MPEYLNFIDAFRNMIVAKGHVTKEVWEKREMKVVTQMLSSFLYNVLSDNSELIKHHEKIYENSSDEQQRDRLLHKIDGFYSKAIDCIRAFLMYSILTNTYDEARSWINNCKDMFNEEFERVAHGM